MCLTIPSRDYRGGPVIADRDIKVYKVLSRSQERVLMTPYPNVPIPPDGKMRSPKNTSFGILKYGTIEKPLEERANTRYGYSDTYNISVGFHSCTNSKDAFLIKSGDGYWRDVYHAVIPKGSLMHKYGGQAVSDSLDIMGRVSRFSPISIWRSIMNWR